MRLNFSTQRSREAGKCCQAETAFLPPQLFKSIQSWMTHQVAQHIRFLSLKHTPSNERLATSVCTTVKNRVSNATAWISPFEVSTTHSNFAPKNLAASTVLKPTRFPLVVGYPVVYLYACVCVSLKTLVHTGAAKFAASLSDAFLPEQEQRDEGWKEEMRRWWVCATCFETVSRGLTSFCDGIPVHGMQEERKYLSGSIVTHEIPFRAD